MRTIDDILDEVLAREGGYVDHPGDRGGRTNYGITEDVARAYGYQGDMRHLPASTAREIYRERFVHQPGFGSLLPVSAPVTCELIDTGVNMGPATAARYLQRALNAFDEDGIDLLVVDGICGSGTRARVAQFLRRHQADGETVLLRALNAQQCVRYMELAERDASQRAFLRGWIRARVA